MQITINLQSAQNILVEELRKIACISSIIFTITVDQLFTEQLKKISNYVQFLGEFPTIKTGIKINSIDYSVLKRYNNVGVGGTFDYLHIGHQVLLLYTILHAKQKALIGVTGQNMLANKKYKEVLQSLSVRINNVKQFAKSIQPFNPNLKIFVQEINDPYGPTIHDPTYQCLIASPQTGPFLSNINQIRVKKQFAQLDLILCPLLSPNTQIKSKVSSSSMRQYICKKAKLNKEQVGQYKLYYINLLNSIDNVNKQIKSSQTLRQKWWNIILSRYSEYWRHYHTNHHIYRLLQQWNSQKFNNARQLLTQKQNSILQVAILFHDIVYLPDSKTNQKDSAKIAQQFINQYLGQSPERLQFAQKVMQLILQTENHVPTSNISQILYDLDMGILDDDPDNYRQYAEGIRLQYWPLVKQKYSQMRTSFLAKTLQSNLKFSFKAQNVQKNLEWEIQYLKPNDL